MLGAGATVPLVPGVAELTVQAEQWADESVATPSEQPGAVSPRATSEQTGRINRYAQSLELVKRVRGTSGVRAFVQRAIFQPYEGELPPGLAHRPLTDSEFERIEFDVARWRVPSGLKALSRIISDHRARICRYLLTTNFDILLQTAMRAQGLTVQTYAVSHNATPTGFRLNSDERMVLHLHGDARGGTLHSPVEIGKPRMLLERWLGRHLQGKVLLVVGYSGWDDVIRRTFQSELNEFTAEDPETSLEVLWAVYEDETNHNHINPKLENFFREHALHVTPFYGIERDRLFGELADALAEPPPPDGEAPPALRVSSFHSRVNELTKYYGFGQTGVSRSTEPSLIFWPHRLRSPHLIHGVHALAAVLFSKMGIPVELHLDDTGIFEPNASRVAARFKEAVSAWFSVCGAPRLPEVFRMNELLRSMSEPDRSARLWTLANSFYAPTNYVFDTLAAAKVINTRDDNSVNVPHSPAHKVLRPLYTWLALENALDRHGLGKSDEAAVVTLGGQDEQKMWDLWRARNSNPPLSSVYVRRLVALADGRNLWTHESLNRDATYHVDDLKRFVRQAQADPSKGNDLLEWFFTVAVRLAATVSDARVAQLVHDGRVLANWGEAQLTLREDPVGASASIANAVSSWFHAETEETT
ncbi:SIR2 family protein [Lentzea aerocolonigenes]|uniref:SIR2 family protein n=1 Tax=Lentzea aerocolonigenes TaxID=68170 RepID=UPI0012E169F2|nr:SIR2 family protein [Lentzea aerocolonigenes]